MQQIIECVPNFSEGRDLTIIKQITDEIESVEGVRLLNVDPGKATNRTVVTFVGEPQTVVVAAFKGIKKAGELIEGLDAGADDYIVKPFKFEELAARLRALSRRIDKPFEEVLSCGNLKLNLNTRTVTRGGEIIELSKKEYDLLELFIRNQNYVLTREILLERIWGFDVEVTENALDALVKLLRKKVDQPGEPSIIKNVRGVGYILRNDDV